MSVAAWRAIAEGIRNDIVSGKLAPGARLPGEEDVAAEWGVSRQTAHKGLAELHRQGYVIRKRRWGTVVADTIPKGSDGRYTLVVDHFAHALDFPASDLMKGLQDGLGENATVVVAESAEDPERELRTLRRAVEEGQGTLVWPLVAPRNTPALQRIADSGHPFVVLDRLPSGLRADLVTSDNEGAARRAVTALREAGHDRVAFLSFHRPGFSSVTERYRGYAVAMDEETDGLERWFDPAVEADSPRFVQAVQDALFALTSGPDRVSAVFCVQDSIAAATLHAAERLGLSVPGDLAIATFNDWPAMMLRDPWSMIRVRQRPYEFGRAAARLLTVPREGPEFRTERVDAEIFLPQTGLAPVLSVSVRPYRRAPVPAS